ncbi:hypothetical protein RND81_12G016700 [Saponaria officinalis]|uniref:Methyltransferase type 11 domain-containing protein n=1 Tax=Saponaria officinalis TaxID=3572 RepID=A0AAW1H429_SAPOF
MAHLFIKQAKAYAQTRPSYPPQLFHFIASKTQSHDLVWDAGTGNGQAIPPLAEIFKNVIATDTSAKQLLYAPKLPNVKYLKTPPNMSIDETQKLIGPESSIDLVTIAQAIQWFDPAKFYDQVKYLAKKPDGVIAAWCYTTPRIDEKVDSVFQSFYRVDSGPYWEEERKMVDNKYIDLEFPFGPVDGLDHTGPYGFEAQKMMGCEDFIVYIKSLSAYINAKEKNVELLTNEVLEKFKYAWNFGNKNNGNNQKLVKFPIYLRIGKVAN